MTPERKVRIIDGLTHTSAGMSLAIAIGAFYASDPIFNILSPLLCFVALTYFAYLPGKLGTKR